MTSPRALALVALLCTSGALAQTNPGTPTDRSTDATSAKPRAYSDGANIRTDRSDPDRGHSDPVERPRLSDAQVIARLHQANLLEIDAGKLAQDLGARPEVKELGRALENDHAEADRKLTRVARKLNVALDGTTLPPRLSEKDAAMKAGVEELRTMKGEAFDAAFAQRMERAHDAAIDFAAGERERVQSHELRAHLEEVLPRLTAHLSMARRLSAKARSADASGRMHRESPADPRH